jgi:hypothetical protein
MPERVRWHQYHYFYAKAPNFDVEQELCTVTAMGNVAWRQLSPLPDGELQAGR